MYLFTILWWLKIFNMSNNNTVTGHNSPDIPPYVRIPVQWQGRIKPTESHITSSTWKLNFRIGGRKPPDITPWFRTWQGVLNQGVMPGGLRPPSLKFSFQNPVSCNRKRQRTNSTGGYVLQGVSSGLATERGFWTRGLCPGVLSANLITQGLPQRMQNDGGGTLKRQTRADYNSVIQFWWRGYNNLLAIRRSSSGYCCREFSTTVESVKTTCACPVADTRTEN